VAQDSALRIAWLLPVAWFYWQPAIAEFTKLFPQTKVFTALWPGFAKGFEDALDVEVVGRWKVMRLTDGLEGYGSSLTLVPLGVVRSLLQFRPQLIFSNSFGIWTILALALKLLLSWQVVIAYEGSAPGVDFRNSPKRLLLRRIMVKWADALISNSQSGKNYLIEVLQADPAKVFAQPYEIPAAESLAVDSELPLSVDCTRPIFLFVGRIMPRKGLRVLLEACQSLKERGYDRFTLLVVGDGEQRQELQDLSQTYHLNDCVQWLGRVDYDQVSHYFQQADVFVLPTFEDTWGVVVLEAMLLGKPVLCSLGAGSSELVMDGENGYRFEPQQPEILAGQMQQFIDHPDQAAQMGDRAQQLMQAHTPTIAAQFLADVVHFAIHQPSRLQQTHSVSQHE
jgi:glycosyltransferase involved in cell wall biosynthesis